MQRRISLSRNDLRSSFMVNWTTAGDNRRIVAVQGTTVVKKGIHLFQALGGHL